MLAIIEGLSNGIFVIFTGGGQKGGLREVIAEVQRPAFASFRFQRARGRGRARGRKCNFLR